MGQATRPDGIQHVHGVHRPKDLLAGASPARLREIRGNSVSYVAQSAAAAFNPAHRLIEQFVEAPVQHG